jgi:hypothetical protein
MAILDLISQVHLPSFHQLLYSIKYSGAITASGGLIESKPT